MSSEPLVPCTQWTGQMGISAASLLPLGSSITTEDTNACFGGSCEMSKETWSEGWKSRVAILITKGSSSRPLMTVAISRPPTIARLPSWAPSVQILNEVERAEASDRITKVLLHIHNQQSRPKGSPHVVENNPSSSKMLMMGSHHFVDITDKRNSR